jgi:hypothetical protein
MSTLNEPRVFDEVALKAMRDASRLYLRHDQSAEYGQRGLIICIKETDEGVWGKTERRIEINVSSRVHPRTKLTDDTKCSAHIPGYSFELKGALALIKPTDFLSLEWIENSNGYVEKAGLAMDIVYLVVRRHVRKELETYKFMLDVTVSEVGAFGRMIQI